MGRIAEFPDVNTSPSLSSLLDGRFGLFGPVVRYSRWRWWGSHFPEPLPRGRAGRRRWPGWPDLGRAGRCRITARRSRPGPGGLLSPSRSAVVRLTHFPDKLSHDRLAKARISHCSIDESKTKKVFLFYFSFSSFAVRSNTMPVAASASASGAASLAISSALR